LATALVHYTTAAGTDRGRKRTSNEDAFGYSVEHGVFVVCDGMGGAAAGEIASSIAVEEMMRLLASGVKGAINTAQTVEEAISRANNVIFSRSQRNVRLSGMGTTLVGLVVRDRSVACAAVISSSSPRIIRWLKSRCGKGA
jgi:protein phosphatase